MVKFNVAFEVSQVWIDSLAVKAEKMVRECESCIASAQEMRAQVYGDLYVVSHSPDSEVAEQIKRVLGRATYMGYAIAIMQDETRALKLLEGQIEAAQTEAEALRLLDQAQIVLDDVEHYWREAHDASQDSEKLYELTVVRNMVEKCMVAISSAENVFQATPWGRWMINAQDVLGAAYECTSRLNKRLLDAQEDERNHPYGSALTLSLHDAEQDMSQALYYAGSCEQYCEWTEGDLLEDALASL